MGPDVPVAFGQPLNTTGLFCHEPAHRRWLEMPRTPHENHASEDDARDADGEPQHFDPGSGTRPGDIRAVLPKMLCTRDAESSQAEIVVSLQSERTIPMRPVRSRPTKVGLEMPRKPHENHVSEDDARDTDGNTTTFPIACWCETV